MFQATLKGAWPSSILVQARYDSALLDEWIDFDEMSEAQCHADIIATFEIDARAIMKEYKLNTPFYASLRKMEIVWGKTHTEVKLTLKDGKIKREKFKINYQEEKVKERIIE